MQFFQKKLWPEFNVTSFCIMKKCQHMSFGNLQEGVFVLTAKYSLRDI